MSNPLLNRSNLPLFSQIKPEHIEPALDEILSQNRTQVANLLANQETRTWDNLMVPLEEIDDRLSQMWSIVNHLNAVASTDDLREVYNACLIKLSDYATEMGQNVALYNAICSLKENKNFTD